MKAVDEPIAVTMTAGHWLSLMGALQAWLAGLDMDTYDEISGQVNAAVRADG